MHAADRAHAQKLARHIHSSASSPAIGQGTSEAPTGIRWDRVGSCTVKSCARRWRHARAAGSGRRRCRLARAKRTHRLVRQHPVLSFHKIRTVDSIRPNCGLQQVEFVCGNGVGHQLESGLRLYWVKDIRSRTAKDLRPMLASRLPTPRRRARTGARMPGGGQGGIRTHGELAPSAVFKTAAFNRSATCP
jgi:hypothetical protein